jgi:hypothetical protein
MMNWKTCRRKRPLLKLMLHPGTFLEGPRKTTTEKFSQYSQYPRRGLNPGSLEYEAALLTTGPRRQTSKSSVQFDLYLELSSCFQPL